MLAYNELIYMKTYHWFQHRGFHTTPPCTHTMGFTGT
jgi:hypothetical protein